MAEEEEIKRLRKVLVPKAQPMPYFDRPFIPRRYETDYHQITWIILLMTYTFVLIGFRSEKHPTVPKEPKFHVPHHKKIKCYTSLDDFYAPSQ